MSKTTKIKFAVDEYVRSHGFSPTTRYEVRTPTPKKIKVLGEIQQVEYTTRKDFEGDETFIFQHDFEGSKKPYVAEGEGRHYILGGGYTVTPHGIEDDSSDSRELPDADKFTTKIVIPPVVTGMGDMYSLTIKTPQGQTKVIHWKRNNKAVLAYNYDGQPKQLYILPVTDSKREKL